MKLVQTLQQPVNGYWDGGAKQTFNWRIDSEPKTDNKGQFVKVGSWDANYWFNVALGKTDKATLGNARRRLVRTTKVPCTFEYVED